MQLEPGAWNVSKMEGRADDTMMDRDLPLDFIMSQGLETSMGLRMALTREPRGI